MLQSPHRKPCPEVPLRDAAACPGKASRAARGTPLQRRPKGAAPPRYRGVTGMGRLDTLLWGAVVVTSVIVGLAPVFVSVSSLAAGPVAAALGGVVALLLGCVGALRWREARRQRQANDEALARRPAMTVKP